ncbi:MAG: hypothetical protein H6624_16135 [Bdellovibrionaceae bacterium]|nr:hypothetical protein [Bdellovibrionales bacterium]MCB9085877.1 hypothetical protein [Pseudobdellovibrionaceae bacterium]
MKKLVLFLAGCVIAGNATARSIIPEPYEGNAEIVSLSQNHMFPRATGYVTFMQGCGDQFLRIVQTPGEQNDLGIREIKVEVKLLINPGAVCLAMPTPVTKEFTINTMDGPIALVKEFSTPLSQIALECTNDMRPVDGALTQVQLVKQANGRYNVIYNVATPGWGAPPENSSVVLASNLKCTFAHNDGLLSSCRKSSREFHEPTNSGFTSKSVQTKGVYDNGRVYKADSIAIEVYSPELAANEEGYAYPPQTYPGRAEISFKLKQCVAR